MSPIVIPRPSQPWGYVAPLGTKTYPGPLNRRRFQTGPLIDPDAQAYLTAVEAADGQALETAVRAAINDFVVGCKADGIWNAIKASCVLAGARTLSGCLVPLVGAAPTNFNFVSGDYNRKTGLMGNGSTKYLSTNRNNNADPQDSNHNAVMITDARANPLMGTFDSAASGNNLLGASGVRSRSSTSNSYTGPSVGGSTFLGTSRSSSSGFSLRVLGTTTAMVRASQSPQNSVLILYGGSALYTNSRLSFYSIGESLDLAQLEARTTNLLNAFAAVIP